MKTKNSLGVFTINAVMTFIWVFTISFTYHHWESSSAEQIVVILLSAVVLYWLTIHPTTKVLLGTATKGELESVIFFPLLGLLREWLSPYQRMARKLADEEAIKKCGNAVNIMNSNFKSGWIIFNEWFPAINDDKKILKKTLLSYAIDKLMDQKGAELRKEYAVQEITNKAGHLLKEFKKRTARLRELQSRLEEKDEDPNIIYLLLINSGC